MRNYGKENQHDLEQVVCNGCGRMLRVENGILKEGCFEGHQKFGFFSQKDGQEYAFDLCESCYDKMIATFMVPVTKCETLELL